jgi:hypothetical protein
LASIAGESQRPAQTTAESLSVDFQIPLKAFS